MPKLILAESFKKAVNRQFRRMRSRIGLYGAEGAGRRAYIRECAAAVHQNVLEIDLSELASNVTMEHITMLAGLWFREARLQRASMVFNCDRALSTETMSVLAQASPRILNMSQRHPGAICITARTPAAWIRNLFGDHIEIFCPEPKRVEQPVLWRAALAHLLDDAQIEEAVQFVSSSYCLTPGEIANTIDATVARLGNTRIDGESLCETLRLTRGRELEGLADLKPTPLGLEDIILSPNSRKVIDEILNYARYSEQVRHDWGFARRIPAAV